MNDTIENLFSIIARNIYKATPEKNWTRLIYTSKIITTSQQQSGFLIDSNKNPYREFAGDVQTLKAFKDLRIAMAAINADRHVWYKAALTIENNGTYKFDFDYDHLPAFEYIPSPAHWLDEFKNHPRPELQNIIQDWIDGRLNFETQHNEVVKRLQSLAGE